MAKSQKRNNREVKKPKTAKTAAAPTSSLMANKGALAPIAIPKKKA